MSTVVPKFTSFPQNAVKKREVEPARNEEKHKRSKTREHDRHHRKPETRPQEAQRVPAELTSVGQPAKPYFAVDTVGDRANLRYENTDRYRVSQHHRLGYGFIVGLNTTYRIARNASTSIGVTVNTDHDKLDQIQAQSVFSKRITNNENDLKLVKRAEDNVLDVRQDFVPLARNREPRPGHGSEHHPTHPPHLSHVRFADSTLPREDDDLETASDTDDALPDAAENARTRQAQLSLAARNASSDPEAWLALIHHQQFMISPGKISSTLTTTELRTLVDIRVSLYEKALNSVAAEAKDRLFIGMLDEGARVWDPDKLAQKWQHVLTQSPDSHVLWTRYIDHLQKRHQGFTYGKVLQTYIDSLQRMRRAYDDAQRPQHEALGNVQLHIFTRLTGFMQACGYHELAVALWQALLDVCIAGSANGDAIVDRRLALARLVESWDLEDPRFGDRFIPLTNDAAATVSHPGDPGRCSPFATFAAAEAARCANYYMPGSSNDEDVSEDPFHVILYSDISPVLDALTFSYTSDALIDAFLCFYGMRPLPHSDAYPWRASPDIDGPSNAHDIGFSTLSYSRVSQSTFLDLLTTGVARSTTRDPIASSGSKRLQHIEQCLFNFTQRMPLHIPLAQYLLAFQVHHNPSAASKTVKRMIKSHPTCLTLYNAAAMIDDHQGRHEKAVKIWQTTLSMNATESNGYGSWLLRYTWAWSEAAMGNSPQALTVLSGTVDGAPAPDISTMQGMTAAARLRTEQALREASEIAMSAGLVDEAVLYIQAYTLYRYLETDHSLSDTLRHLDKQIQVAEEAGTHKNKSRLMTELLEQFKADVIALHSKYRRTYRSSEVIKSVDTGLRKYPDNTRLLETYIALSGNGVTESGSRLRESLHSPLVIDETSSADKWIFTLCQAMARYENLVSENASPTPETLRSSFTRCLLGSGAPGGGPMSHVPRIWILYFYFERGVFESRVSRLETLQTQGRKAVLERRQLVDSSARLKRIFLDGIVFLPWCKDWILMGLHFFDRADEWGMAAEQLRGVYNVLLEREMRVCGQVDI